MFAAIVSTGIRRLHVFDIGYARIYVNITKRSNTNVRVPIELFVIDVPKDQMLNWC